ncbi:MAG: hypothetical protein ACKO6B_17380 [Planctomycetia bacterium]
MLTPKEREERERMLHALVEVKEAVRLFEEGDANLGDTVRQVAAVLLALRAA